MSPAPVLDSDRLRANLAALDAMGLPRPDSEAGPDVRLLDGAAGATLSVATGDRWARLHSDRDPVREADRLLAPLFESGDPPSCLAVIGLGLGYVLDALERRHARPNVLVLEPVPKAVLAFLGRRDWTSWLAGGRLRLLCGPDYRGKAEAWRSLDADGSAPVILAHPVLARECAPLVALARETLSGIVSAARANARARKAFAGPYLLNTLGNLGMIQRSGDVSALSGRFTGVPAIVAAAGPSLDDNLRDVVDFADRALIVSTDTALLPLLAARISPDFVVGVDPQESNAKHLLALPTPPETCLVAEGSLHPTVFEAFSDRTFVFEVSGHHPWPWLASAGLGRGRLKAWGSVLVSALDLALSMGCDPVLFVGADLGYTERRPYCRGTAFESVWAEGTALGASLEEIWSTILASHRLLHLPDISGRDTPTTSSFIAFRERVAEESELLRAGRLVNATGRGFLAGGRIVQSSLRETLSASPPVRDEIAAVRGALLEAMRRRTLAADVRLRVPDGTVIDEWIAFTGGTVTSGEIEAALRRGMAPARQRPGTIMVAGGTQTVLGTQAPLSARAPLPPTSHIPERAAAIRAILADGDACPTAPGDSSDRGTGGTGEALLQRATTALGRLLRLPRPALRLLPGIQHAGALGLSRLSLTAAFDWMPVARPDVDELERCGAQLSELPQPDARDDGSDVLWTVRPGAQGGWDLGVAGTEPRPVTEEALGWWAKRALLVEWARIFDAVASDGSRGSVRLAEWIRDVANTTNQVRFDQASVELQIECSSSDGEVETLSFDLQAPAWRVIRALSGTIVPVSDVAAPVPQVETGSVLVDAALFASSPKPMQLSCRLRHRPAAVGIQEPRARFLRGIARRAVPAALPLPASYSVASGSARTAIVTPYLQHASVEVDAVGAVTPLPAWPHPISGEARGKDGCGLAWSRANQWYLMRRASPDAPVEVVAAPFRPGRAVLLEDGSSYWTATTGGLWTWSITGELRCLVETPPLLGLTMLQAGLVRLDPVALDISGRSHLERLRTAWTWDPRQQTLTPFDVGPEGQAATVASGEAGWASVHTACDLVRVGALEGTPQFDLAVEWPVDAAWAGSSLVVVTAYGDVLLFSDIMPHATRQSERPRTER